MSIRVDEDDLSYGDGRSLQRHRRGDGETDEATFSSGFAGGLVTPGADEPID